MHIREAGFLHVLLIIALPPIRNLTYSSIIELKRFVAMQGKGEAVRRVGGMMLMVGALSVVATSACYAIAPVAAAMPVAPMQIDVAMDAAQDGGSLLRLIALISAPGDVVTAAGALLLAFDHAARDEGMMAAGLLLAAMSSFFFLGVDLIGGVAVPHLSALGAREGFAAAKIMFDAFFMGGVICLGLAGLAYGVGATQRTPRMAPLFMLIGLLGVVSGMAALAGANVPQPMGISVALAALAFCWVGRRTMSA
jgi:hypothetical protein